MALLFSTNRALPSGRAPRKRRSLGGIGAAFAGALSSRELELAEFGAWIRAQQELRSERPEAGQVLEAFEEAVARFLPGYRNLRTEEKALLIDREGVPVPVRSLSDGERGVLALVLDLTRRLAQANPGITDPAATVSAVVLIDEIELHLHPKWQRQIVRNLQAAFPKCQFIATTHSPQVIGEVEHDRIQIISDGEVHSPAHSYGVDSSRVLEEVMDAKPRTGEIQELLTRIAKEIAKSQFGLANKSLALLADRVGENDPEVTRLRTLLSFMEGDE